MHKPIAERYHRIELLASQRHLGIGTQLLLVVLKERVNANLLLRLVTALLELHDRRKILEAQGILLPLEILQHEVEVVEGINALLAGDRRCLRHQFVQMLGNDGIDRPGEIVGHHPDRHIITDSVVDMLGEELSDAGKLSEREAGELVLHGRLDRSIHVGVPVALRAGQEQFVLALHALDFLNGAVDIVPGESHPFLGRKLPELALGGLLADARLHAGSGRINRLLETVLVTADILDEGLHVVVSTQGHAPFLVRKERAEGRIELELGSVGRTRHAANRNPVGHRDLRHDQVFRILKLARFRPWRIVLVIVGHAPGCEVNAENRLDERIAVERHPGAHAIHSADVRQQLCIFRLKLAAPVIAQLCARVAVKPGGRGGEHGQRVPDAQGASIFVELPATAALFGLEEFPFAVLQRLERAVLAIQGLALFKGTPQAVGIRPEPADVAVQQLELDIAHAAVPETARKLAVLVFCLGQVEIDVVEHALDQLRVAHLACPRRILQLANLADGRPHALLRLLVKFPPVREPIKASKEIRRAVLHRGKFRGEDVLKGPRIQLHLVADEIPRDASGEERLHLLHKTLLRQSINTFSAHALEVVLEIRRVELQLIQRLRVEHALKDAMVGTEIDLQFLVDRIVIFLRIGIPCSEVGKQKAHDLAFSDTSAQARDADGTIMLAGDILKLGVAVADHVVAIHAVGVEKLIPLLVLFSLGYRSKHVA